MKEVESVVEEPRASLKTNKIYYMEDKELKVHLSLLKLIGKDKTREIMIDLGMTEEHTDDEYNRLHFYGNEEWLAKFRTALAREAALLKITE